MTGMHAMQWCVCVKGYFHTRTDRQQHWPTTNDPDCILQYTSCYITTLGGHQTSVDNSGGARAPPAPYLVTGLLLTTFYCTVQRWHSVHQPEILFAWWDLFLSLFIYWQQTPLELLTGRTFSVFMRSSLSTGWLISYCLWVVQVTQVFTQCSTVYLFTQHCTIFSFNHSYPSGQITRSWISCAVC